jgi:hypothetical protein
MKEMIVSESVLLKFMYGLWIATAGVIIKFIAKILKKKNETLEDLIQRMETVEANLTVRRSDGSRQSLACYVQEINHKLDNKDKGDAGVVHLVLDDLDN